MIGVTGAGGYVGGRLVGALVGTGRRPVRALVRTRRPWLDDLADVDQVEIDLAGPAGAVADALAGCEVVVHLAGANEVVAAEDPDRALAETITGTRHVAAAGIERVVYLSTVHVYGASLAPRAHVDESTLPQPRHPYGIARLASEHLLAAAGAPTVLRLTNGVGAPVDPRVDRWSLVVPDLCREAILMGTVTLKTPGLQWRDFLALTDACAAIIATVDGTIPPGTWNVGAGRSVTIRQVAEQVRDAVERATGKRPELHAPSPGIGPGPEAYTIDVSKLSTAGFTPTSSLQAAIDETVRFCIEHKEQLSTNA